MNNRISQEKKKDGLLVKIKAHYEEGKQKQLLIWLLAWTFCGLFIAFQLFGDEPQEIKKFILIFLAFWIYFEYKIVKVYRWRKSGEEQFWITPEYFHYGRTYNNRGILKPYRKDLVNQIRPITIEKGRLLQTFFDSYWVIGDETLMFSVNGKVIGCGMRLSEKEQKKVMQSINQALTEKS
tara:strand:+ start:925 stop:1464 length:540 start_codon:yes stop_codon:yes gene_type:complete